MVAPVVIGQFIAAAVAAAGTAISVNQQRKAQEDLEDADAVSNAQRELENARNIRQAINTNKLERARLVASGQAQTGGIGSTSAVVGALGSARTQGATNIGFANQVAGIDNSVSRLLSSSNRNLAQASITQQLAALPAQFGFGLRDAARDLANNPQEPELPIPNTTGTAAASAFGVA